MLVLVKKFENALKRIQQQVDNYQNNDEVSKDLEIMAICPPAEITVDAWQAIRTSIKSISKGQKVHIKIDGEEDLLVLPFIVELPLEAQIVYGQPNQGAVVRVVDSNAKSHSAAFLDRMHRLDKN